MPNLKTARGICVMLPMLEPVIGRKDVNRRALRVFASAPEGYAMNTPAARLQKQRLELLATCGSHGEFQDWSRLRLLDALRGDGALVWPGGSIAVAYELDQSGRGPVRLANGNLEGIFSAISLADPDDAMLGVCAGAWTTAANWRSS